MRNTGFIMGLTIISIVLIGVLVSIRYVQDPQPTNEDIWDDAPPKGISILVIDSCEYIVIETYNYSTGATTKTITLKLSDYEKLY